MTYDVHADWNRIHIFERQLNLCWHCSVRSTPETPHTRLRQSPSAVCQTTMHGCAFQRSEWCHWSWRHSLT